MRITYFNYHHDIQGQAQGAAVQIRALAQGLANLGHQVQVQFLAAYGQGESQAPGPLKKISWLRRYGHFPRLLCRNIPLYRRELHFLKEFQPDVVLAVSSYGTISPVLSARRLGLPLVLFCEAPLEYEYSRFLTQYYPYSLLGRWCEGYAIRQARQVVCISRVLQEYFRQYGAPATKFQVIPNGVDHLAFHPGPPDPQAAAALGLQGKLVIGFVGSFQFFANLGDFFQLVQSFCRDFPDLVFFFVGAGEAGAALQDLCQQHRLEQHCRFIGVVDHSLVPRYLSLMDIVLSPYRGDYLFYGSSMKLLEYLAAGKAVLATALGQIKEVIQDGVNGLLYDPDDWQGMTAKLGLLIRGAELRQRLGVNARRSIEQDWTWDHQAGRLAQVLSLAISGR